jgi:hypothetical protein
VEPPLAVVPRRGPAPHRSLRLGAGAAAAAVALSSSGDAILLAVLLGLASVDLAVAGVGALVALGVLARWGTTSLASLAGIQAVLGPAGVRGDLLAVGSSWAAAVALLVTAAALRGRTTGVLLGLTAALVVAGPAAAGGPAAAAVRMGAALAGGLLGAAVAGRLPRLALAPALVLAGAGALAAVVA